MPAQAVDGLTMHHRGLFDTSIFVKSDIKIILKIQQKLPIDMNENESEDNDRRLHYYVQPAVSIHSLTWYKLPKCYFSIFVAVLVFQFKEVVKTLLGAVADAPEIVVKRCFNSCLNIVRQVTEEVDTCTCL